MCCVVLILSPILGAILWLLWNAVVPDVFGCPAVTYAQAVVLTILLGFVGSFFAGSSGSGS